LTRERRTPRLLRLTALFLLSMPAAAFSQGAPTAASPAPDLLPSRAATGAVFTDIQLRDLPGSGTLWTLVETVDEMTIVDRIENGGLYLGEPKLMGNLGSSWTQTGFTIDGVDATNPGRTGIPLAYLDARSLSAVRVVTSLPPVDLAGGGPTVAVVPRTPLGEWKGQLEAAFLPTAWQAVGGKGAAPPIAKFDRASDGGLLLSGPVSAGTSVFLLGHRAASSRFERGDPTRLDSRLTSLFLHALSSSGDGGRFRLVAGVDAASRPFAGRARFPDRGVASRDRYYHGHAIWERAAERGTAWSLAAGFARSRTGVPDAPATPVVGVIERLLDGPVMETVLPGPTRDQRFDAVFRLRPDLQHVLGGTQTLDIGASAARTTSMGDSLPRALIGELTDGLPSRAWDVSWGGETTLRRGTELAAWVNDRIGLGSRVSFEAGVRFQSARATARDNPVPVSWRNVLPRGMLRINLTRSLTLHTGLGLYQHRLPLDYLAYGDTSAPTALVRRWVDANGDRLLQASEMQTLIARSGPGIGSLDPALKAPTTREWAVGLEARLSKQWRWRLTALQRHQRDFVAPVNIGVTAADYTLRLIPDRGNDFFNPEDDRLLKVYDRNPASFGKDRLLLTNPPDDNGYQAGIDLAFERLFDGRWFMLFAASAQRSDGYAANTGFHANENDTGVLGELFENPNASSYARARLFFERGYIIKWSGGVVAPGGLHVAAIARYQDGQHFARMAIVPDLNQGPTAIQAYTRGHSRFTFSFTLDARVEKRFDLGRGGLAVVGEAFNLLNNNIEVEEDPVVTRSFRATTAVQPPRAVRLGFRIDF
jgi:hypothetical protein